MRSRKKDFIWICLTLALLLWTAGFAAWLASAPKTGNQEGTVEVFADADGKEAGNAGGETGEAAGENKSSRETTDGEEAGNAGGTTGKGNAGESGSGNEEMDVSEEIDRDDWRLILVNFENPLPEEFSVTTASVGNGHAVDVRCASALKKMLEDCRKEGLSPLICSSYRTWEKQRSLYENKVSRLEDEGYEYGEALKEAAKEVAVPGNSEHQTGLAVDIVDETYQQLDEKQEDTKVQKWLLKNSWKYGFILRYPPKKSDITQIIYEPWHYRYVGKKAAAEIHKRDLCLEEYLQQ